MRTGGFAGLSFPAYVASIACVFACPFFEDLKPVATLLGATLDLLIW